MTVERHGFLTFVLLQLSAAVVGAGCSAGGAPATPDGGNQNAGNQDSGTTDARAPICTGPRSAPPYLACEIAASPSSMVDMDACAQICAPPDAGCVWGDNGCSVTSEYYMLWYSAHQAGMLCPDVDAAIVDCLAPVGGRGTAGFAQEDRAPSDAGEALAQRAYLEAVSVFAFERLARELLAHDAPPPLVHAARRARNDEVRHAAIQSRFARRYGRTPRRVRRPAPAPTRQLFEMALENAIEGCVRETYGALVGLIEARTSSDLQYRRASRRIALDECRHAELAWAIHEWACSLLPAPERCHLEMAIRHAVDETASSGASHAGALRQVMTLIAPSATRRPS